MQINKTPQITIGGSTYTLQFKARNLMVFHRIYGSSPLSIITWLFGDGEPSQDKIIEVVTNLNLIACLLVSGACNHPDFEGADLSVVKDNFLDRFDVEADQADLPVFKWAAEAFTPVLMAFIFSVAGDPSLHEGKNTGGNAQAPKLGA